MLAASKGSYDIAKTDTFSFGVLSWQVWTQREPYTDPPYASMSAWRKFTLSSDKTFFWLQFKEIEEFVKSGKRLEIPKEVNPRIRELIEKVMICV